VQILRTAGTIIALVIGAAFATGQEALQFFVTEGLMGIAGLAITLLIGVHMSVTLLVGGRRHEFRKNQDFFIHYAGRLVGTALSWYSTAILFSIYVVMLSGAGAVLNKAVGLSVAVGTGIMAVFAFGTLLFGLKRLVDIVGTLGPLLVLLIVGIAGYSLFGGIEGVGAGDQFARETDLARASEFWWLSGALYMALQALALASILPAIGATLTSDRQAIIAGILGPVFLSLALLIVILALLSDLPNLASEPIPMMSLASNIAEPLAAVYAFVIIAGIYTTCAPVLWIVLARFAPDNTSSTYRPLLLVLSVIGFGCATLFPFAQLVNLVYPTIGYAGLLVISLVIFRQIKDRSIA
jgi:uncharacterized membrane protein YkvI